MYMYVHTYIYIYIYIYIHIHIGWKISYPEIGYPEFCQLIEQENRDPNKALGQSIKSHRGTSICVLRSLLRVYIKHINLSSIKN